MSIHKSRPPVKFIDKPDVGLGSSVVVSFAVIVISVLFFAVKQDLALALFFGHALFLFISGTGLHEGLNDPQPHPEPKFENGYILGASLTIIMVALTEWSLSLYFKAQIGAQMGLF